ncbi:MAG: helix-turn-helix transcriptional regulator [Flavobacterium sp.]
MTNKEKYLQKMAGRESNSLKATKERNKNKFWLKESRILATKILIRLDELGISQKDLAAQLEVTPQYVNKLVKGDEKFGWDILVKLQQSLKLPILNWCDEKFESIQEGKIFRNTGQIIKYDFTKGISQKLQSEYKEVKEVSLYDADNYVTAYAN